LFVTKSNGGSNPSKLLYLKTAITRVQPSSKREGFATVPDVSWDDIGALQNVRDELKTAILVKYFLNFNLNC
jgi:SpoVK/Ycf46/Vps4 family AAA+-type ATPase